MKIFVYSYREFDEAEFFQKFSKEYGVELGICKDAPTLENAHLAEGYEYLSIITTKIDAQLVERFHELGVKMISTRTIGFDHIDLQAAKKFGMSVSNVSYSPECVADYTLMLMLMAIRKMKRIMQRAEINDFSLPGIQGESCTILPWEYLEREGSDGRSSVICQGSGVEFTLMMPMKMKK